MLPSPLRAAMPMLAALMLSLPIRANPAPRAAALPAACEVAKAAHLDSLIGEDATFLSMIDTRSETAAMTMCAYEGKDGRHYGLSIRETFGAPNKSAAQLQAEAAVSLRRHGVRPAEPDIGEAALWIPTPPQLMVWLDGGRVTLTFIGDATTPDLATHLAIAGNVLKVLQE